MIYYTDEMLIEWFPEITMERVTDTASLPY
jgi:hypothetical protein